MRIYSAENMHQNKEAKNAWRNRTYFSGFLTFIDSSKQQIPRPVDGRRCKLYYSGKKKG